MLWSGFAGFEPSTVDCALQEELNKYPGVESCKTDLIRTKSIVFVKFRLSSQALTIMEELQEKGMVGLLQHKL